jgi:Ca2+-transporting ATPase
MTTATIDVSDKAGIAASPHTFSADDVASRLQVVVAHGLTQDQIKQRSSRFGPNQLPEGQRRRAWSVFLSQFKSAMILVLVIASILSAVIGNLKDALVILAVVVINAIVSFYQEYRAEQSLAVLQNMLPVKARVRRGGISHKIFSRDLVPGDIVMLEAGDLVPADGRLILVAGAEADESALTGESVPVGKIADQLSGEAIPLGERVNMLFMNTLLTRGRAEMIVTATGSRTEMGLLSQELAATVEVPTPLQRQLDQLGKRLGAMAVMLVSLLAFLEFLRGTDIAEIVLDAIALSVAAMPEGLPVVVTVTLALGMRNMARNRAIVKRLASVETLGCTTVICSDKTGTLTMNQMTARMFIYGGRRFDVSGEGYQTSGFITPADGTHHRTDFAPLLLALVACNDSQVHDGKVIGDPMEAALLILAQKGSVTPERVTDTLPRIAEIAFDTAHKFMATFHREDDTVRIFVKGAPDVLLGRCSSLLGEHDVCALDEPVRRQIDADYAGMARNGLRGLLIASRSVPASKFDTQGDLFAWMRDLTLIGLIGLMDPPRPEAKAAIAECRQAGIAVKMITGDHPVTAAAIATELGIHGNVLTGADLDRLDPTQLAAAIADVAVFARVTPTHKVNIVRALQQKGHVVAMTGDGVNDAPALKSADIGVAMGTAGTAVAKEAATMVLTDDNFATLVSAVHQGRTLYDNILKFVRFQLSTTIGAILTVFFAPLAGLPEPFSAIQILWVALIMDGPPAVSLALDAARPGIMHEPPRKRDEPILPLFRLAKIIAFGVTMMVGTLAVLYYSWHAGMGERAITLGFTTFVLFQVFNVFNARVERGTAFNRHFFDNPMLWASLGGVVALQAIAVHWQPAQEIVGTSSMTMGDWGIAVSVAASILVLEESRKLCIRLHERLFKRT